MCGGLSRGEQRQERGDGEEYKRVLESVGAIDGQ
jgi:hypothetical protein